MNRVTFSRKPTPQIVEYRPLYKISKILLVLYLSSRGGRSSLIRLHLFDWCMKDESRMEKMSSWLSGKRFLLDRWGIDPALNYAINISLEEGLVEQDNNNYKIKPLGIEFAESLVSEGLFKIERGFLSGLGKKVTESKIEEVTKRWLGNV